MSSPFSSNPDQSPETPPVRARVPEAIAGGVFSTGAIVVTGKTEFLIDFVRNLGKPNQIVARVVIPHAVMPQFVGALSENMALYRKRFGDLPSDPPGTALLSGGPNEPAQPISTQPDHPVSPQDLQGSIDVNPGTVMPSNPSSLGIGETTVGPRESTNRIEADDHADSETLGSTTNDNANSDNANSDNANLDSANLDSANLDSADSESADTPSSFEVGGEGPIGSDTTPLDAKGISSGATAQPPFSGGSGSQNQKSMPNVRRASPEEVYDELKIADELLSGQYANAVMIGHGPHEFNFDFITSFFPQSSVSARVFLSAGQIPRLYESLKTAWLQVKPKLEQRGNMFPPPKPPRHSDDSDGNDDRLI